MELFVTANRSGVRHQLVIFTQAGLYTFAIIVQQ
jgi:hypothetical protein